MGDRERPVERDRASEDTRLGGGGDGQPQLTVSPAEKVAVTLSDLGWGRGGVLEQNGTSSGQTAANFQEFFKLLVKHSQP